MLQWTCQASSLFSLNVYVVQRTLLKTVDDGGGGDGGFGTGGGGGVSGGNVDGNAPRGFPVRQMVGRDHSELVTKLWCKNYSPRL